MGAQNGLIGMENSFDLPTTQVQTNDLATERNMAKFAKTTEFKKLKEHMEARIDFYQAWLPDGRSLTEMDLKEAGERWLIANSIIGEFKAVLMSYELAREAVDERVG